MFSGNDMLTVQYLSLIGGVVYVSLQKLRTTRISPIHKETTVVIATPVKYN